MENNIEKYIQEFKKKSNTHVHEGGFYSTNNFGISEKFAIDWLRKTLQSLTEEVKKQERENIRELVKNKSVEAVVNGVHTRAIKQQDILHLLKN